MKYSVEERRIWLDGAILPVSEAKIGVLSPSCQFGLNVFEGIPCYWSEKDRQLYAFRLESHYKRLLESAKMLDIDCQYEVEDFEQALREAIMANEYKEDISVRQTLFVEGNGTWSSTGPTGMFVAPIPRKSTSAEYNKKGLRCEVSSWRRIDEEAMSPRIKCGANYINSRLGQREAIRNGYDTCIFLNRAGRVSEAPGSCVFLVKEGTLITPILTESILASITRDSLIQIAKFMGISVEERQIDRSELYLCDEAFLCGSAMAITPVTSFDGHAIGGSSNGSLTSILQEEYWRVTHNDSPVFAKWLTSIYLEEL